MSQAAGPPQKNPPAGSTTSHFSLACPRPAVRLWDSSLHAVTAATDNFKPSDADRWSFNFSFVLPTRPTADQMAKIRLIFDYTDARFELAEPAREALAQDKFLSSEQGFW